MFQSEDQYGKTQSARLEQKSSLGDPILVSDHCCLVAFLTLLFCILLPSLMVDSVVSDQGITFDVFTRILAMPTFTRAITKH